MVGGLRALISMGHLQVEMYLICNMTSQDHLTEELCKFTGGGSLQYVTTLTSLVTIRILTTEMCF